MAVNECPIGVKPQFVLNSGLPAAGNKLFFYAAGSSTKQATFTDATGVTANANPIVLNSLGEPDTQIWFTEGVSYKIIYAPSNDTDPPTSPIWSIDNLRGINDTTVVVDQWQDSGFTPTFLSTTSFSVPGDQTSVFQQYRRLKMAISAGTVYGFVASSVFGAATTVTVTLDSGVLDTGLSTVAVGVITPQNTSIPANYVNAASIQNQTTIAAATGGTSAAYTLTLVPAVSVLAANQLAFVKFHTAAGATPTLAVNGLAAKSLKYRDASGVKQSVTATQIPTDWTSDVFYDGTDYVVMDIPPQVISYPTASNVQTFLAADVALNNTANYFNVCNTGSIGASGQKWLVTAVASLIDTGGLANILVRIWDGSSVVYCETATQITSANARQVVTVNALVTLSAATTFHLSCKDLTLTTGSVLTTGPAATANKATSITAIRVA